MAEGTVPLTVADSHFLQAEQLVRKNLRAGPELTEDRPLALIFRAQTVHRAVFQDNAGAGVADGASRPGGPGRADEAEAGGVADGAGAAARAPGPHRVRQARSLSP